MTADAIKAAAALFVCVIVQSSILSLVAVLGGTPDLVLVALVAIALLRGSVFGAIAGFWAGFLLDTATLDTPASGSAATARRRRATARTRRSRACSS
jgi:rod shape-determining protein MreD